MGANHQRPYSEKKSQKKKLTFSIYRKHQYRVKKTFSHHNLAHFYVTRIAQVNVVAAVFFLLQKLPVPFLKLKTLHIACAYPSRVSQEGDFKKQKQKNPSTNE